MHTSAIDIGTGLGFTYDIIGSGVEINTILTFGTYNQSGSTSLQTYIGNNGTQLHMQVYHGSATTSEFVDSFDKSATHSVVLLIYQDRTEAYVYDSSGTLLGSNITATGNTGTLTPVISQHGGTQTIDNFAMYRLP